MANLLQHTLSSTLGEFAHEQIDLNERKEFLVKLLNTKDDVLFLTTSKLVMQLLSHIDNAAIVVSCKVFIDSQF